MTDELDAGRLVDQAVEMNGLDDFGPDGWREGLDRLVEALIAEARLSEIGVTICQTEIAAYLSNRLQITAWRREHPEVATASVAAPVVIVGQARTGTTILHDLLAQDPANRVPLTWEVDQPLPPPATATYAADPRIDEVQAGLDMTELLMPGFKSMHPMGARLPQECVRITGSAFRSLIFPSQYRVPSYAEWLLDAADMSPAYQWHRMFLQHLQAGHPGERWVLKSPGHQWCLGALVTEYPDAVLVQTHRDPLRIIASLGSLLATLRGLSSEAPSITECAAEFAEYVLDAVDRSVTARMDGTVPAERVVDVQFRAFMADPFGTIRSVYEHVGAELTPAIEQRMREFLAAHPDDEHGRHTYKFSDTGLDEDALRERARRYQDYFSVPSEQLG